MPGCYKCKIFVCPKQDKRELAKLEEKVNTWFAENPAISISSVQLLQANEYGPEIATVIIYNDEP